MSQYPRWQTPIVTSALKTRRVVIIAGARQCGKTTVSKSFEMSDTEYRTLDDKLLLQAAKTDPGEFVKHQSRCMIIDEIQKAPELLPAIKKAVDDDNRPGQFLLTGSSNIQALPGVTESLAGRIRTVSLRPLSQGELRNHQPNFLEHLFLQHPNKLKTEQVTRDEIIEIALCGGYPEVIPFSQRDRQLWHQNYIDALLERDLKDIIHIRRLDAMSQLMHVISAWSTKPIDISAIGSGLSLQRHTVESYFNALEALYLIDRIPAYGKTDYARVGKQSKLIMNDSGLMSSILRLRLDDIRFDADRIGKLIETHVGNELQKHINATEEQYVLYHYKDREKREIDFVIENEAGDLLGIEVKASTSVDLADFKHLRWFKENLKPARKNFMGIVLYAGNHISSLGDGMWAIPITALY
ncbi:MAG: hypothetical protein A3F13_09455 [Gammaproteobacteria bacterium RIFCSPHIGHO2_12_FULL_40_19]|nr:MAG: hypothetical protein A3F13_09455 [Gammaproteobacteria bacterium RIFCSPHIGHO2_12_FULL_40_19]